MLNQHLVCVHLWPRHVPGCLPSFFSSLWLSSLLLTSAFLLSPAATHPSHWQHDAPGLSRVKISRNFVLAFSFAFAVGDSLVTGSGWSVGCSSSAVRAATQVQLALSAHTTATKVAMGTMLSVWMQKPCPAVLPMVWLSQPQDFKQKTLPRN